MYMTTFNENLNFTFDFAFLDIIEYVVLNLQQPKEIPNVFNESFWIFRFLSLSDKINDENILNLRIKEKL